VLVEAADSCLNLAQV